MVPGNEDSGLGVTCSALLFSLKPISQEGQQRVQLFHSSFHRWSSGPEEPECHFLVLWKQCPGGCLPWDFRKTAPRVPVEDESSELVHCFNTPGDGCDAAHA